MPGFTTHHASVEDAAKIPAELVAGTKGHFTPADLQSYVTAAGVGAFRPLYHTGVASSAITGAGAVAAEQEARRITTAANALGINGFLDTDTTFQKTGTAGIATYRCYIGAAAAAIGSMTKIYEIAPAATGLDYRGVSRISNRGATNSQFASNSGGQGGWGVSTVAPATASVDTTATWDVVWTVQLANAADSVVSAMITHMALKQS